MLKNGLAQTFSSLAGNFSGAFPAALPSNATGAHQTSTSLPDAIVAHGGQLYFPVSDDMQRLLSLDSAGDEEIGAAFAGAARQAGEPGQAPGPARFRRDHANGQQELHHFFAHDVAVSVVGVTALAQDELLRLARGQITIAAGAAAFQKTVRVIPAGTLAEDFKPFRGWYVRKRQTTWHSVYPPVASGRPIASVTHLQADGSRKPVQVAVHDNRHSYSIDGGRSWTPTGASHGTVSEIARAAAWSRLFVSSDHRARNLQSQSSRGHGG